MESNPLNFLKNNKGYVKEKPLMISETGRAVIFPKTRVEDCEKLRMSELKKSGKMKVLRGLGAYKVQVTFDYSIDDYKESIPLAATSCYFGGYRWWFICPSCNKRVAILYRPYSVHYFRCRHCHNLTYILRQIHRNSWETFVKCTLYRHRLIKLLETLGQKGVSKRGAVQMERLKGKIDRLDRTRRKKGKSRKHERIS